MESTKLHIVLLSSPGKGHLIPVVQLGKRLVTRLGFRVTVLSVGTDVDPTSSDQLQIIPLPPVHIDPCYSTANILTILELMMRLSVPHIRAAIDAMNPLPSVLIADYFSTSCLSLAKELNMAKYVYVPSNAWCVALTIYSPNFRKNGALPTKGNLVKIPGCKPVQFDDILDAVQDPDSDAYADFVRIGSQMATADGLLTNTWDDLESTTIKAFRENEELKSAINGVPIYPIGPLIRSVELSSSLPGSESRKVLEWLEKQPAQSVVYISFGSGGNLSVKQLHELACGLELSKQRFVWVIRPPVDQGECEYLSVNNNKTSINPSFLPQGFLTRTMGVGLLVAQWAPQAEILAHPSVGGFLSHCGWNSTLESLVNGVPIIAWPLFAEQNMTADMLTDKEIGVSIRAMEPSKGLVSREEIAKMVRMIIMDEEEGERIRVRAKELKESAETALSKGGSSYHSINLLAKLWLNH